MFSSHVGPTSQLIGLKGYADSYFVPEATAHLQVSARVHTSIDHGCLRLKVSHNVICTNVQTAILRRDGIQYYIISEA